MKLPIPPQPVYDLSRHLEHVQKRFETYPLNTYQKCSELLPDILDEICDGRFPHQIAKELGESVRTVLRQNQIFFNDVPDEEQREYLVRLSSVLSSANWATNGVKSTIALYKTVLAQFPPSVFEAATSDVTVPLYTLIADVPGLIADISNTATTTHHGDIQTFENLHNLLAWNTIEASGYELETYDEQPLVFAHESDLETGELVKAYLHNTPFFELLNVPVSFKVPDKVRNEHTIMVASTGSGKTQLIQRDVLSNLMRPDGPGMVVIDSQNQMIPKLEKLRAAQDRIVIVDPFDASPPALNMFLSPRPPVTDPHLRETLEANTLQQFAWIFSALDQELTGRQTTLFTFTTRILLAMHANMQTLLDFMRIEKSSELRSSKFWPYIEADDEQTRYFFEHRFCTSDYNKTKGGVADRLLGVLRVPSFNRMFMAPANNLDLYSLLAERKLVVFNTHKSRLGNDASAILGRYAIALYIRAAFERELDPNPPPAYLYIDEASEYFGRKDSSDTLFTQLRKYNCGTFVAFQDLSQLGEQQHTLIANTSTKMTGGLSVADARRLAPDMRTTEQELLSIRKRDKAFQMMCYVANTTDHAIKLSFAYGAAETAPQLTGEEHAALRQRNRQMLSAHSDPIPRREPVVVAIPPTPTPSIVSVVAELPPTVSRDVPSSEIRPGKDW